MHGDFDISAYADKIRDMVVDGLKKTRTAAAVSGAIARVACFAEETLADNLANREAQHIACRAGCGTCCVVNVSILFPEAIAIAAYVRREFSGEEFAGAKERTDKLYAGSRWLDEEERLFLRHPCAFLDEAGACAIYPVRPFLCRSVTSTDPESCLQAVALPALGESRPVLMNLFQKSLMSSTFEAMGRGLDEMGLDSRGVRLTEAVKILLDRPELAEEFMAGRRIDL